MSISTPVVFLIFNRPEETLRVFDTIARARPTKLLIVADGSRFPEESEKCAKARSIVNLVDWDCEIMTNFSEKNLGCRRRVSSGLDWAFSIVNEAIIIEDDCLPTESFFYFCQELLRYYSTDNRIFAIGGNNFQPPSAQDQLRHSYYFSKYPMIWGWATWRRAWEYYDVNMASWPEMHHSDFFFQSFCREPLEKEYWKNIFDQVYEHKIDTWDYQLNYAFWLQSGLSIIPKFNLVSNIGYSSNATHTLGNSCYANLPTQDIWNIVHPPYVIRNEVADSYDFSHIFGGSSSQDIKTYKKFKHTLSSRMIKKIRSFLSKINP